MLKKSLSIGIIFFLVISSVPYSILSDKISTGTFGGNTIYVGGSGPGNYSKIQDAVLIDNSMEQNEIYPNDAEIEIVILENMSFIIRNIGYEDAINVTWETYLTSWLLILGSGTKTGIIEMIPVGSEEIIVGIEQSVFLLGFGPLNLVVTASAENAEEVTVSENIGFLLGILVIPNSDAI